MRKRKEHRGIRITGGGRYFHLLKFECGFETKKKRLWSVSRAHSGEEKDDLRREEEIL